MSFYFKTLENVDQINWKRTCVALLFVCAWNVRKNQQKQDYSG